MTPRSAPHQSNSLKTFFIYAVIVCVFIVISLAVKSFFLLKQSKFDGQHQFILVVSENNKVKEIELFHPSDKSVTKVILQGREVSTEFLAKTLGIIPDAYVNAPFAITYPNTADSMRTIASKYLSLKTNLTVFDVAGLFFAAQKASINNQKEEKIIVEKDLEKNDQQTKNLFIDNTIFSENASVQIINASGEPGMGKRLERALTNLGSNIVAVSSSRIKEKHSAIQYFGNKTYTARKLEKLLSFPSQEIEKQAIAEIVITIGEDNKNTEKF